MLAFKMKKAMQSMGIDRMLRSKVDTEKWGPDGVDLIQKLDGMRERVREASQAYSEKGAEECREVFGRYQALVYKGGIVCQGINMKELQLGFKWSDAFDSSAFSVEHDWSFERACVIFNLAAAISFLATHQDRTTPEGLKGACQLYQQAAGALSKVQELVKAGAWRGSADLAVDTLSSLEGLMLAQARCPPRSGIAHTSLLSRPLIRRTHGAPLASHPMAPCCRAATCCALLGAPFAAGAKMLF